MINIIKKIVGWRMLILLFWMFVIFLVISQPAYTVNLNPLIMADENKLYKVNSVNSVMHLAAASAAAETGGGNAQFNAMQTMPETTEPYIIPVVLKAEQQALLSSLMDGYIESIAVKEGDVVKKGQLLAEFNCKIQQAQYDKTIAQLEEAKVAHAANIRLKNLGAISDPEVEKTKFAFAEANAELGIKKELVDYCKITAPFNGTVVRIYVKQYQNINRNVEILELLDNSTLRVELIAPSNWLSWLTPGYKFKVDIMEVNKSFPAAITSILPKIDAVSQTVRIIAKIEDGKADSLIAGMNGKAYFTR